MLESRPRVLCAPDRVLVDQTVSVSGDAIDVRIFEGVHATLTVRRVRAGVVIVILAGTDIGELHDAPFRLLERILDADGAIELFIDTRGGRTVSIDVSNQWAMWLRQERARLRNVHMLAVSRFLHVTATVVRRFAGLGPAMHVTSDAGEFDRVLGSVATR